MMRGSCVRAKRKGVGDQAEENRGGEQEEMRACRWHGGPTVPIVLVPLGAVPLFSA